MKITLTTADLMPCWSVRRFIDELVEELAQQRSLVALLPEGVAPTDVWDCVWSTLWRRDFCLEEVFLSTIKPAEPPAAVIARHLNMPNCEFVQDLYDFIWTQRPPSIVYLREFEILSPSQRTLWLRFIAEWARASQTNTSIGLYIPPLCLITSAPCCTPVPTTDIRLAVHTWWGVPSGLEMRLLCRAQQMTVRRDLSSIWREHMVPAIAGNDVLLINHIWNEVLKKFTDINHALCCYAQERQWTCQKLEEWGANKILQQAPSQMVEPEHLLHSFYVTLWMQGAVCWTPEYGLELHSAVAAQLGDGSLLRHRLWREQVALLLPIIDIIRLSVCQNLSKIHGDDWPQRLHTSVSDIQGEAPQDALDCELGYLAIMLKRCHEMRASSRWLPLTEQARYIRNALAHYENVYFDDFCQLVEQMNRMGLQAALFA